MKRLLSIAIALLTATGALLPDDAFAQRRGGGAPSKADSGPSKSSNSSVKPYDEVITEDAETQAGLFIVHQLDGKVFYEIPTEKLNKDMLWVTSLEQTQAGFSYAGMPVGDRVVRWELRGEKVLLRDVKYSIRAEIEDPITDAVRATSVAPIVKVFSVDAWGPDQRPVINVTSLFKSDVTEFSAKRLLGAGNMDTNRSFIEEVKSFPENINVEVLATYSLSSSSSSIFGGRGGNDIRRDPTQSSITAVLHHSMRQLPEDPMTPRVFDPRVGFFTVGFQDFADDSDHQVESVRYITRWRVEKSDPEAEVSEVVKPIVFYVGRGVPEKWKPYVKKGIEMWQPAFEEAGFKNAIIGKLAPSANEDPDWDPEDSRISTIRWLPSMTENAFGPHVHDPRTGEILEADVRIYHNVMKLARDWYFVQASPNDPRAQKLPLPDELIGELLAYIVAHEVGHSIGFPHNMKASSHYTVDELRSAEFTKKYGTEASIMDYGRFNYVAQPGDGATLIPVVGPYDFFAVKWGYGQYVSAEKEKEGQAALVAEQKENPVLRFGNADPSEDPTRQTEDLGSDSLAATVLGMKNIDRVADYLVEACAREGEDYDLLNNMYSQLLSQRTRELMHVTAIVGGYEEINLFYGDADQIYHPIAAGRQKKAVQFLIQQTFKTNPKLISPQITLRLETSGAADRILSSQRSILSSLMRTSRLDRMAEQVQRVADSEGEETVYRPEQLLNDLTHGIWSELKAEEVSVDLYRRNLQRTHVEMLADKVEQSSAASDVPGLCMVQLKKILRMLDKKRGSDAVTQAHLAELTQAIKIVLDPNNPPKSTTP
ncbi:MAG: zinc-dependent metalloprotease [Planctomycetota bacterium]|nr:zinc-dependent metalloprotease [Planctomycetota bacterium]